MNVRLYNVNREDIVSHWANLHSTQFTIKITMESGRMCVLVCVCVCKRYVIIFLCSKYKILHSHPFHRFDFLKLKKKFWNRKKSRLRFVWQIPYTENIPRQKYFQVRLRYARVIFQKWKQGGGWLFLWLTSAMDPNPLPAVP